MAIVRKSVRLRAFLGETALHEFAVKMLARRMRSELELRRLLRPKVEPDETGSAKIAAVMGRLKEYGYLDDTAFANNYAQLRQQNEKLGPRRVKQDLGQKGVSQEVITEAVDARYAEVSEEALARQHLERKRIAKPQSEKEILRVMRLLIRAGFSTGTIYKILRQWQVPDEVLISLETAQAGEESQE